MRQFTKSLFWQINVLSKSTMPNTMLWLADLQYEENPLQYDFLFIFGLSRVIKFKY